MVGIELLSYNNNLNDVYHPALASNDYYSVELGTGIFYEISDYTSNLVGPISNSYWGHLGSANGFRALVSDMREYNYLYDSEYAIYYEITNYSGNTLYFDSTFYASNTRLFDTTNSYSKNYVYQVGANSTTYGYIGQDYFNVILNNSYNHYWLTFVTRSNSSANYSIKYEIVGEDDSSDTDLGLVLYKFKTSNPTAYNNYYDYVYTDGYDDGYAGAIENMEGTYIEGFEKGQEIGYQKAQSEKTILADTFEILHEGISAGSSLLNQKLTPNLTLGQIAFFPVTVTIVLFLIRSLVA